MMTYSQNYQTRREKKMAIKKWFLSATCRMILIGIVALFGVLYVAQISSASTQGYTMRDLQKQITSLQQDNQKLEFAIANQRSMKNITERIKNTNLILADNVQYATLIGSEVAVR